MIGVLNKSNVSLTGFEEKGSLLTTTSIFRSDNADEISEQALLIQSWFRSLFFIIFHGFGHGMALLLLPPNHLHPIKETNYNQLDRLLCRFMRQNN